MADIECPGVLRLYFGLMRGASLNCYDRNFNGLLFKNPLFFGCFAYHVFYCTYLVNLLIAWVVVRRRLYRPIIVGTPFQMH